MNGTEEPIYADLSNMHEDVPPVLLNESAQHNGRGHGHIHEHDHDPNTQHLNRGMLLEQDRFLPIANISRVMKRMIPNSGKMSKGAKELVQECVSEFISFITSEANDRCLQEKRKTVSADDLLEAMESLGFDNYVEPLRTFLRRFREENNRSVPPVHMRNMILPNILSPTNANSDQMMSISPMSMTMSSNEGPVVVPAGTMVRLEQSTSSKPTSQVQEDPSAQEINVNELQPSGIQIMVDPNTMQHYMVHQTDEGDVQLIPISVGDGDVINIQSVPVEENDEDDDEEDDSQGNRQDKPSTNSASQPPPHQNGHSTKHSITRRRLHSQDSHDHERTQTEEVSDQHGAHVVVQTRSRGLSSSSSTRPTRQTASKRPRYH